jgi:hypothetical protein
MRKFMKILGFLSVLATVSDASGFLAAFRSTPLNEDVILNDVISGDVVSEDSHLAVKKPRRPRRAKAVEEEKSNSAKEIPQPSSSSNATLFADIVANREIFTQFNFGVYERNTLCAVNQEMGEDTVGLLLLEPSGILNTLLIDRNTMHIIHKKASIPHKELRGELASHGVLVPDARLIASQVAGVKESSSKTTKTTERTRAEKKPSSNDTRRNDDLRKMRERISEKGRLSSEESHEIIERYRKQIQESNKTKGGN